jgi:hypothetical protein
VSQTIFHYIPRLSHGISLFFGYPKRQPFGGWWLLAPSLFVGFLGGGVYVGAFSLIAKAGGDSGK